MPGAADACTETQENEIGDGEEKGGEERRHLFQCLLRWYPDSSICAEGIEQQGRQIRDLPAHRTRGTLSFYARVV